MSFLKKIRLRYWIIIAACIIILPIGISLLLLVVPFPLRWELDELKPISNNVVLVKSDNELPYLYKQNASGGFSGEDFKIVVFTDIHLKSKLRDFTKNNLTIEMMRKNIEREKPDLVVITGDILVDGNNRALAVGLAEMMEKLEVFWAPVYGNHDGELRNALTREECTNLWSGYEHCLIEKGDTHGYGNYVVNIKTSEDKVSQSLIFMDSGSYMTNEEKKLYGSKGTPYDFLKEEQIEWYKDKITNINTTYAEEIKSLLFMHIPLVEYNDAWEKGEIISGQKREKICSSAHNSGMFDAILELGSTQAIFSGHDHINDFHAVYKGVNFIYVQPSGYAAYDVYSEGHVKRKKDRIQGCNVVTVSADGSFTNQPLMNKDFD